MNNEAVYRTAPATPGLLNINFRLSMNWSNGPIQFLSYNVSDYIVRTVLETPLPGQLETSGQRVYP